MSLCGAVQWRMVLPPCIRSATNAESATAILQQMDNTTATDTPDTDHPIEPLVGCVVAITSDRRREELAGLLRRRGAEVLTAPTMRIVPLQNDQTLRAATEE